MSTTHLRWRASVQIQQRARELRKNLTPAEQKLWQHLRQGQIDGLYWRTQHAVGTYIVDFFCANAKMVVEAACPASTVIRFTNREVLRQCEAVVQQIADECQRLMGGEARSLTLGNGG